MRNSSKSGRTILALLLLAVAACTSDQIVGVDGNSQAVSVVVGNEMDVTLGNPTPGVYAVPPSITSSVLIFLSEEPASPTTAFGPSQRFRFKANATGTAVITFNRMLGDSVESMVVDTILVHGTG